MIMRPPQQGHGGRWSAAALAARSASSCSVDGSITCTGAAISSRARDVCLAGGAGEQSVVADAVEPLWQNVEQEAPDAFAGRERHRAKPLPAVAAVNPCGGRLRRAGRGRPAGYSIGNIEARCAAVSVACRSMVTCSARVERFEQCFRISSSGRRRIDGCRFTSRVFSRRATPSLRQDRCVSCRRVVVRSGEEAEPCRR
jgi:hypothetical protein